MDELEKNQIVEDEDEDHTTPQPDFKNAPDKKKLPENSSTNQNMNKDVNEPMNEYGHQKPDRGSQNIQEFNTNTTYNKPLANLKDSTKNASNDRQGSKRSIRSSKRDSYKEFVSNSGYGSVRNILHQSRDHW